MKKTYWFAALFVAFVLGAFGCIADVTPPCLQEGPVDPSVWYTFRLWVQDDPSLLPTEALAGCTFWKSREGVNCELVEDSASADLLITVNLACTADSPFGIANGGGHIEIFTKCISGGEGVVDSLVIAHEIGHELGLGHIPLHCDGSDPEPIKMASSGEPICGDAVMNPEYNVGIVAETDADHLAFASRTRGFGDVSSAP